MKIFVDIKDFAKVQKAMDELVANVGKPFEQVLEGGGQEIKLLVAHLYENRESVTKDSTNAIPYTIMGMLDPYKVKRLNATLGG